MVTDPWTGLWNRLVPSNDPVEPPPLEEWECPACGWAIRQPDLPGGHVLEDVRDDHIDLYCARPAPWPPG